MDIYLCCVAFCGLSTYLWIQYAIIALYVTTTTTTKISSLVADLFVLLEIPSVVFVVMAKHVSEGQRSWLRHIINRSTKKARLSTVLTFQTIKTMFQSLDVNVEKQLPATQAQGQDQVVRWIWSHRIPKIIQTTQNAASVTYLYSKSILLTLDCSLKAASIFSRMGMCFCCVISVTLPEGLQGSRALWRCPSSRTLGRGRRPKLYCRYTTVHSAHY